MECYCTNHCACQPEALMQCRQELSNALRSSCQQDQRIEINPKSIGLGLMIMFLVLIFVIAIILFYVIKRKLPICYRKKKFKTYVYKSKIKSGEDLEIDQYTNRVRRASSMMFGEKLPRVQERMTSAHDETVNYIPERKSRSRSYSLS